MTDRHDAHEQMLRDPREVVSLTSGGLEWSDALIQHEVVGPFWDILEQLGITLLVTREYEHLVLALSARDGRPGTSCLRLPHPSGLAVDRAAQAVYVACTRNPNQIVRLEPSAGWLRRGDDAAATDPGSTGLVPVSMRVLPGCLYLHDLAVVDGRLLGNAVGLNGIVPVDERATDPVWWPASIEGPDGPDHSRNLIQLNSIAAGESISSSFFTASTERAGDTLPGDLDWNVDRQGVVFSGATREVVARGLTRPHSARLDGERLWVADSGYGTVNLVDGDIAPPVARLGGWTRGLCVVGGFVFVGTSRVIRRFRSYAPGVDVDSSRCGVHIVDSATGRVAATLWWPDGDQIFALEWVAASFATGFLGGEPGSSKESVRSAWYHYRPPGPTRGRRTEEL